MGEFQREVRENLGDFSLPDPSPMEKPLNDNRQNTRGKAKIIRIIHKAWRGPHLGPQKHPLFDEFMWQSFQLYDPKLWSLKTYLKDRFKTGLWVHEYCTILYLKRLAILTWEPEILATIFRFHCGIFIHEIFWLPCFFTRGYLSKALTALMDELWIPLPTAI